MNSTPSDVFAQRLRQERMRAGLSQTQLATRVSSALGVTVYGTAVTRMEKGERVVKLDEAVAIAGVLGVDLTALLVSTSEIERVLQEQRAALASAQSRFEEARDEVSRLTLIVRHLEEQRKNASPDAALPNVVKYEVDGADA